MTRNIQIEELAPFYFIACYNYILEKGAIPYVKINRTENTIFPPQFKDESFVLFKIGPEQIADLTVKDDAISFRARFNGVEGFIKSDLKHCTIFSDEINFASSYPFFPLITLDQKAIKGLLSLFSDKLEVRDYNVEEQSAANEPASTAPVVTEPTPSQDKPVLRTIGHLTRVK